MNAWLPDAQLLSAFIAASFVLAVTPGPGVLYIVTRSLTQGRRTGLASVAAVALGNLGNALGAALGLGALFAISSAAFTIVKYVGAAYLIYLGVQALRSEAEGSSAAITPARAARVFRDGFLVALFNPKTALFFAAFLPQFISAGTHPLVQSAALGTLFVLLAATTDTAYALAAGAIAPWLTRATKARSAGRYITGSAFIALGVLAAASESRTQR